MKPVKNSKYSKSSKGERLKWDSLRDVKPVYLTKDMTKGVSVVVKSTKTNLFVP